MDPQQAAGVKTPRLSRMKAGLRTERSRVKKITDKTGLRFRLQPSRGGSKRTPKKPATTNLMRRRHTRRRAKMTTGPTERRRRGILGASGAVTHLQGRNPEDRTGRRGRGRRRVNSTNLLSRRVWGQETGREKIQIFKTWCFLFSLFFLLFRPKPGRCTAGCLNFCPKTNFGP